VRIASLVFAAFSENSRNYPGAGLG
jgi:hypothetical protein